MVIPVIVIVVDAGGFGGLVAAIAAVNFVKTNGADTDGAPLYAAAVTADNAGVPENNPDGNVIVTVSAGDGVIANPPGTVKVMVREPLLHAAVPLTRPPAPGIHFFAVLSHDVPTSQHPGP